MVEIIASFLVISGVPDNTFDFMDCLENSLVEKLKKESDGKLRIRLQTLCI